MEPDKDNLIELKIEELITDLRDWLPQLKNEEGLGKWSFNDIQKIVMKESKEIINLLEKFNGRKEKNRYKKRLQNLDKELLNFFHFA